MGFVLQAPRTAGALILALSVATLGAAFAFQYLAALDPCPMCIYQRYPYAVAIGLSAVALALAGRSPIAGPLFVPALIAICGVTFAVGAGIAATHVGIEQGWLQSAACSAPDFDATDVEELLAQLEATPVARCDQVAWSLLGISLAGYNLIASAALSLVSFAAAGVQFARRARQ